ncbi:uncharacterized protein L969DRAFT_66858 [Mixia osmundae IAM 14324]|uniref:uncharacterized protein n=1 Tax=Mixia osmundae (strain CBS 9802 / IAM 14324 / JCM 22182 / KY 12970) TaxID=764103 RepID=UPI0004A55750|nr:uncharacterized protein L969DRAFT_66858 [Mixia osmundae IAM 14324]KEI36880.1 hypothetical protein L969DRAFT_66858 [Mixia osmundae IAM 14324]
MQAAKNEPHGSSKSTESVLGWLFEENLAKAIQQGALSVARSATRGYATESAKKITIPVQLNGLSGKYAGAAYSAALRKSEDTLKQAMQVETDLTAVTKALKDDAKLSAVVFNPTLSVQEKKTGLTELFKKAGGRGRLTHATGKTPNDITKNLFDVLNENGRLHDAAKVVEDFQEIMSAHRGEVVITVTTATPLESSLQSRLEKALKQSEVGSKAKQLKVVNKVNPNVQGGLVVDFGDKSIDLSVASRVNKLNALIAGML